MAKAKGRKPDYDLSALNKDTEERGKVGAAWRNDDGSISIRLNPCVVLQAGPRIVLTLFPNDGGGPQRTENHYDAGDSTPI